MVYEGLELQLLHMSYDYFTVLFLKYCFDGVQMFCFHLDFNDPFFVRKTTFLTDLLLRVKPNLNRNWKQHSNFVDLSCLLNTDESH